MFWKWLLYIFVNGYGMISNNKKHLSFSMEYIEMFSNTSAWSYNINTITEFRISTKL